MSDDNLINFTDKKSDGQSETDVTEQKSQSDSEIRDNGSENPLESLTLIDEHEEEYDVGGRKVTKRGIYLLPNLFTTAALFCGFFAIVSSIDGRFEAAAIAIFMAMVFDGLDGRVARLTHSESKFGQEYDSLADMVSFGVAPALVMFVWALAPLGKIGWTAAFIYLACAALRLAKFNTQIGSADKNYFSGLASPAAASMLAGMIWFYVDANGAEATVPFELSVIAALVTVVIGALMILNVQYYSFKGFDFKKRVPFVVIIAIVLIFAVVMVDPPSFVLIGASIYALSGPVFTAIKRLNAKP